MSYIDCILISVAVLMILAASKGFMTEARIAAGLLAIILIGNYSYINSYLGPSDDSAVFHFPSFRYIADFIRNARYFPDWFEGSGGIRTGYFEMNLGTLLPHRLIGYLIYSLFLPEPLPAYKLTLAIGVWLYAAGTAILVNRWLGNAVAACLAGFVAAFSGAAITTHQEQTIFTMMLAPWFILALLEFSNNRLWLIVASGLLGLATTQHYPQIQVLSLISFVVVFVLFRPSLFVKKITGLRKVNLRILSLAALVFSLGAMSLPYMVNNIEKLSSPLRVNLTPSNIEEFRRSNNEQLSSVSALYMQQYIKRDLLHYDESHPPDKATFYIGLITLSIAAFGIFTNFRVAAPVVLLCAILSFFTMGKFSPIPLIEPMYHIFPWFIKSFRQWFHFVSMQQFSIIMLFSIGIQNIINRFQVWEKKSISKESILYSVLLALLTTFLLVDLLSYRNHYLENHSIPYENKLLTHQRASRVNMKVGDFPVLMRYRSREQLCLGSREYSKPYIANKFIFEDEGNPWNLCDIQVKYGPRVAVFHSEAIDQLPSIETNEGGSSQFVNRKVLYKGLYYDVSVDGPSILVTEVSHDLNVKVAVDGLPSNALRANGGLVAVAVPHGRHDIYVTVISDYYSYAVFGKIVATIIIIVLIIFLLNDKRRAPNPSREIPMGQSRRPQYYVIVGLASLTVAGLVVTRFVLNALPDRNLQKSVILARSEPPLFQILDRTEANSGGLIEHLIDDGLVDSNQKIQFMGWAIDSKTNLPAASVVMYLGDRAAAIATPRIPRPRLAQAMNMAAEDFGFVLEIPKTAVSAGPNQCPYFFSKNSDGKIQPLTVHPRLLERLEKHFPSCLNLAYLVDLDRLTRMTRAAKEPPLAELQAQAENLNGGVIDGLFEDDDTIHFTGWAIDKLAKIPALAVVMYLGDRPVDIVKPTTQRPDLLPDAADQVAGFDFALSKRQAMAASDRRLRFFSRNPNGSIQPLEIYGPVAAQLERILPGACCTEAAKKSGQPEVTQ